MIMQTKFKNLADLNAALKRSNSGYKVIFIAFMPSSGVGMQHQTRHYLSELTNGRNAGATTGDFYEIAFNSDSEDFF